MISWAPHHRQSRSDAGSSGARHPLVIAGMRIADALRVPPQPAPVKHTHVEAPEKPHQAERRRWQGYRGLRGTCATCERTAVPKRRDGRLWSHLDPRTELWCPGGSR